MRRKFWQRLISGLASTVLFAGTVISGGSGQLGIGYVITDEEGHAGVNQETFNLYKGPSVSINDFSYLTTNGLIFSADLNRITLNNRNLRASASKPALFGLSLTNNQYRRIYDEDGGRFTRRRSTGGAAHFYPVHQIKLFGGYNRTDKHGDNFQVFQPVNDTVIAATDYTHTRLNLGAQARFDESSLRAEYQRFDFTDDAQSSGDRKTDKFVLTGFAPIPGYKRVVLSGGYIYRRDAHEASSLELTTNQGWGGIRASFSRGYAADYRLLFARTRRDSDNQETDNVVNTISVSRNWPRYGGLRLGYENRISDDLIDRTVSNSVLLAGWLKFGNTWLIRGRVSTRAKDVKTGATLTGDENFTRHQVSVKYNRTEWGNLTLRYQGRIKTNDDLDTRVEYNALTAGLNLKRSEYGRLTLVYTYYLGKYENRSLAAADEFEFSDHVLTGMIYPATYKEIETSFGATYYRSLRDRDTEKFSFNFGVQYLLPMDHLLEVRYRVYNFDDFQVTNRFYTGNIIEVNVFKEFTL